MRVFIRKTHTGAKEYWDTEEKRLVAVPKDVEPDFDVVVNPKSMVEDTNNKVVKEDDSEELFIENMNAKQLRAYAADNGITIPFEIKKTEDIRSFILDYEASLNKEPDGE